MRARECMASCWFCRACNGGVALSQLPVLDGVLVGSAIAVPVLQGVRETVSAQQAVPALSDLRSCKPSVHYWLCWCCRRCGARRPPTPAGQLQQALVRHVPNAAQPPQQLRVVGRNPLVGPLGAFPCAAAGCSAAAGAGGTAADADTPGVLPLMLALQQGLCAQAQPAQQIRLGTHRPCRCHSSTGSVSASASAHRWRAHSCGHDTQLALRHRGQQGQALDSQTLEQIMWGAHIPCHASSGEAEHGRKRLRLWEVQALGHASQGGRGRRAPCHLVRVQALEPQPDGPNPIRMLGLYNLSLTVQLPHGITYTYLPGYVVHLNRPL